VLEVHPPPGHARFADGRYVLEPGGALRAGPAPARQADAPMPPEPPLPPLVRTLDQQEVERLWLLVRGSSLADPLNPASVPPGAWWSPPSAGGDVLVEVHDHAGVRRYAAPLAGGTPLAAEARALLARVQALAWRSPPPVIGGD